jgi:putative ABC transport system permease protein
VSAGAVLRASGGATRRLVQTVVVFLLLAAASATALLGVALATNANESFFHGFAAHRGADVAVSIDSGKVPAAQLAATAHVRGVTKAAGPYPEVTVTMVVRHPADGPKGGPPGRGGTAPAGRGGAAGGTTGEMPLNVVGRASQAGPLDDLTLQRGHWPTGPGQIVLASSGGFGIRLGAKVAVTDAPGKRQLTVVGYGGSPARFGDAWVDPGEIAKLRPEGAPATVLMLYTFTQASTAMQVSADVAALRAALPAGAVTGFDSWLGGADQTSHESSVNTPFVVAFGLIGLVLAVLIVANVVSGAVLAGYRRIGVLKSIGFTPLQVAAAYVAQTGAPALAGVAAGTVLGNWWVTPRLNVAANLFKVGPQRVPLWIDVAVPAGMCALVGLAALVPALRAGRLSAVQAITAGQAPRAGHGYVAHRLAGRLALPRPVTVGLAAPFTRPSRSAATLAAIVSGVTAVILAVGLYASLAKVNEISNLGNGQVQIAPVEAHNGPPAALTISQREAVEAALRSQPGTLRYVAEAVDQPLVRPTVTMPTLPNLGFTVYNTDSAWLGYRMLSGHWYSHPGEVDVNASFLTQTGLRVGDRFTLSVNGKPTAVRIAGQVYHPDSPDLFTSWQTLGGPAAGLAPELYDIALKPRTDAQAYITALSKVIGPQFTVGITEGGGGISGLADKSLIRTLAVLVAVLAGLGVLSSVLLATRERVHDLGIFKVLGMTPRQAITMVICWVIAPAVTATIIAVPVGIIAHSLTVQAIGKVTSSGMPASVIAVYQPAELALLGASGLAIAAVSALAPASWAAAARTVAALRAE